MGVNAVSAFFRAYGKMLVICKENKIHFKELSVIEQWGRVQTWNLSKILHRRIFRLKILHCQFHLISTVLVRKNTKNE